MVQIAEALHINVVSIEYGEDQPVTPEDIGNALDKDSQITHVGVCHCETTSGILNPIQKIGHYVKSAQKIYFVDAMSSLGGIPVNITEWDIDYLVSSANKCIEGVPGFSFILAKLSTLLNTEGYARSVSLDLLAQYKGLEKNGQFRFTPPTHTLLAFHQALLELEEEGGVLSRMARYQKNHEILMTGMRELGFQPYLKPDNQGPIITSFYYPNHPNFSFDTFYRRLQNCGHVIYPGKVGNADCFRIGTIGRIFPFHIRGLLDAIRKVLGEMDVQLKTKE